MHESQLRLGGKVKHRGNVHYVHDHYLGVCGRRIVQVSPNLVTKGEGIVCNNVPVEELEQVEGQGESSGGRS